MKRNYAPEAYEACELPAGMPVSLNSASLSLGLADFAARTAAAGFEGVELWSEDIARLGSAERAARIVEGNGLRISAHQLLRDFEGARDPLRGSKLEQADALMAEASAVGAPMILLCANTDPSASTNPVDIVTDLRVLADMAAFRGLKVGLEPLAWSQTVSTYPLALECVEAAAHPDLGLTIDAFHWFWGGTPIEFVSQLPVGKCLEVQLCDARPEGRPAIRVARHDRLFPGEGSWPVAGLMRALVEAGFDGFVNLEVFSDELRADPDAFVRRALVSVGRSAPTSSNIPGRAGVSHYPPAAHRID